MKFYFYLVIFGGDQFILWMCFFLDFTIYLNKSKYPGGPNALELELPMCCYNCEGASEFYR